MKGDQYSRPGQRRGDGSHRNFYHLNSFRFAAEIRVTNDRRTLLTSFDVFIIKEL